jgi:hypothetical protein
MWSVTITGSTLIHQKNKKIAQRQYILTSIHHAGPKSRKKRPVLGQKAGFFIIFKFFSSHGFENV